ncbi:plasmid SOS inhibition protein A [Erwinia sp. ErVv1]|uniref:plasmid SOS inhibition protein A n=1 Tax=Erwinia sp. ErVv1 TaxID=1603299 RepID=UPI0009EE605F
MGHCLDFLSFAPQTRYSLDELIRTRGERCPLPLSLYTGQNLFPETLTRTAERQTRRIELRVNRRFSREAREREQTRRRYQNRLAQAEIDLAFHTPSTVGSWMCMRKICRCVCMPGCGASRAVRGQAAWNGRGRNSGG